MTILEYYQKLIESMGYVVNDNGDVLFETSKGEMSPIRIDGKALVLPTKEFQNKPDWNAKVAFHPLSESIARGESEVIQKLQDMIRVQMWKQYTSVGETLLVMAANDTPKGGLTAAQTKILSVLADADEKTVKAFGSIISRSTTAIEEGEDRRILNLYLRRGGTANGERYSRQCVVSFPLYEAICAAEDSKDRKVFGVELRVKDIKVLKALHEVMLPGSDTGAYNYGTTASIAPYFVSLMGAYVNMANQLNNVLKPFMRLTKSVKPIDTSWDVGDDLKQYRAMIPPMPYNEGHDVFGKQEATPQPVAQQPAIQPPSMNLNQPAAPAPAQQPQYQPPAAPTHPPKVKPESTGNGLKWGSLPLGQQQMQMQMGMQQPMGMMQPQMPMQMPMQGGVMMQSPYQAGMMQPQPMMNPWQPQMPLMANGMPQPPMPQPTQPQQQQQFQPQMGMQQPMMMQPQMQMQMQPQFQPQFQQQMGFQQPMGMPPMGGMQIPGMKFR